MTPAEAKIDDARVSGCLFVGFILIFVSVLALPMIYGFFEGVARDSVQADAVRAGQASWSKVDGFKWKGDNDEPTNNETAETE